MADDRVIAAGEDTGNPATMLGDLWPTDCIDPTMQRIQATGPDPVVDRVAPISHREQLISRHDAVLVSRKLPRLPCHPNPLPPPVIGRLLNYSGHRRVKSASAQSRPLPSLFL